MKVIVIPPLYCPLHVLRKVEKVLTAPDPECMQEFHHLSCLPLKATAFRSSAGRQMFIAMGVSIMSPKQ